MSASRYFKCLCQHCRGRIEFPIEGVGTTVACPHCGEETDLSLQESDEVDRAVRRTRVWAIGGLIVLVLLLVAAFVAVHMLQNIAPRVRQTRASNAGQRAPTKPATAANISSTPADAATIGNSFPPVEWLRTNDLPPRPSSRAATCRSQVVLDAETRPQAP